MTYKVGNAFITVAPSLAGFEDKVRAYLKTHLHDAAINIIPKVDVAAAKAQLDELGKDLHVDVSVDADTTEADAKVDEATRPRKVDVDVDVDVVQATAKIGAFATLVQNRLKSATQSLGEGINEQTDHINASLASIKDAHISGTLNDGPLLAEIEALRVELADLSSQSIDVSVRFNAATAAAELESIAKDVNARITAKVDTAEAEADLNQVARDREAEIKAKADIAEAEAKMGAFAALVRNRLKGATQSLGEGISEQTDHINAALASIKDAHISGSLNDKGLLFEIDKLRAELDDLSRTDISIEAKFNALAARTELESIAKDVTAQINVDVNAAAAQAKLDEVARTREAKIKVDVDAAAAEAKLSFLARAQQELSLPGRGAFSQSGLIQAAAVASPVIAPAAIAGIGGLGAALVGSLGLVGVVASLVGNIQNAISGTTELKAAQLSGATAAQSQASAENGLINAQQGVRDASYGVVVAEQNLANAQLNAKNAQLALNDARQAARRELVSLGDTLKAAELAASGSKLGVLQAELNLRQVRNSRTATVLQVAEAVQALKEAELAASEANRANRLAIADAKVTRAQGVAGNPGVVSAQQQVAQATQAIASAQHQVADAVVQVGNAQRQLAIAQSQVAIADQAVATATDAIAKAQAKLSAPGIAEFNDNLTQLKETFATFLSSTSASTLGAASEALKVIGDVLTAFAPATKVAGQAVEAALKYFDRFVKFHPLFDRFLKVITRLGPTFIEQFVNIIGGVLRVMLRLFLDFAPLSVSIGDGLVYMVRQLDRWTYAFGHSKTFHSFVAFIKANGPIMLSVLGSLLTIGFKLIEALAPVGAALLRALAPILRYIAGLDPDVILAIVAAIALTVDPVAGLVLGLAAIYQGIKHLYDSNTDLQTWVDNTVSGFKPFTDKVPGWVSDAGSAFHDFAVGFSTDSADIKSESIHVQTSIHGVATSAQVDGKTTETNMSRTGANIRDTLAKVEKFLQGFARFAGTVWDGITVGFHLFGRTIVNFGFNIFNDLTNIVGDVFAILGDSFNIWADLFKGDFRQMFKDMKQILRDGLSLLGSTLTLAGHLIKVPFQLLGDALSAAWSKAWDKIGAYVTDPINFVVGVINDTLIAAINWLTDKLGLGDLVPPIPFLAAAPPVARGTTPEAQRDFSHGTQVFAAGGATRAGDLTRGGQVPGHGSTDSYLGMFMPKEFVFKQSVATQIEHRHPGLLERINSGKPRRAERGHFGDIELLTAGEMPHFATGGDTGGSGGRSLGDVRGLQWMSNQVGKPYLWGAVGPSGYDCSGLQSALTNVIRGAADPYFRLGATASMPWAGFAPGPGAYSVGWTTNYGGSGIGHTSGTLDGTNVESAGGIGVREGSSARSAFDPGFDHIMHLALLGQGKGLPGGTGQAGGGGIGGHLLHGLGKAASAIADPLGYMRDRLSGAFGGFGAFADGPFGKMLMGIPLTLAKLAATKVKDLAVGTIGDLVNPIGPTSGPPINKAVAQYGTTVIQVLKELIPEQPQGLYPYVLSRMMRESSGNPNAVNRTDSNWLAGTPSVGLMQVIGPTFAAYAGKFRNTPPQLYGVSTNAEANIFAGLNYALHRYGNLVGPMMQPGGYDSGGVASGAGWMEKRIIAPERVLGPSSTRALDDGLRNLGGPRDSLHITGMVSIDEKGQMWIRGIANDEVKQEASYRRTLAGLTA